MFGVADPNVEISVATYVKLLRAAKAVVARLEQAAAVRAALQAAHGWLVAVDKSPKWENLVADFTKPVPGSEIRPDAKAAKIYDKLLEKYADCESDVLDII